MSELHVLNCGYLLHSGTSPYAQQPPDRIRVYEIRHERAQYQE